MKQFIAVLLISILPQFLHAQFTYDKLLDKKGYSKIHKKLAKQYAKNPDDVSVNFDYSVLFSEKEFEFYHLDSAYKYAKRTEALYPLSDKADKLNKNLLNEESIKTQVLNICLLAFNQRQKENSIESYNHFLKTFTDEPLLIKEATTNRNQLAFKSAEKVNTVISFQSFIDTYPDAFEISQAIKARNSIAYLSAKNENTIISYQKFIDTYPYAEDLDSAVDLRDQLAFKDASMMKNSTSFSQFLTSYPRSKLKSKALFERDKYYFYENVINDNVLSHINFLNNFPQSTYRKVIEDSIFTISVKNEDLNGLHYLVVNSEKSNLSDSVWYHYYQVFNNEGKASTYSTFIDLYEDYFSFRDLLIDDYSAAILFYDLELENGYQKRLDKKYKEYISRADNKYYAINLLQKLIKPHIDKRDWKGALTIVQEYKPYFKSTNRYFNDLEKILIDSDKNISRKNMGTVINTKDGSEHAPVISADNKYLYFCGIGRFDNYAGEDIFVSENKNGRWQKPVLIDELSTLGHDAPLSISTDGNKLFTFQNGDLYYSDLTYNGWSKPVALPSSINSDEWEADAMMTSDGNAIIFVSQREDINKDSGINLVSEENIDIYVSTRTEKGWSYPINLGNKINTRHIERSPYLHSDMKTLYFSSNGHGGLGDLDVFKVTRLSDTSWTEWSEPINMGKEINSSGSDWGYKVSTDGKLAYFTAVNNGENDLFTVDLPLYLRPGQVATIAGKLLDNNNNPIESTIKWEDLETGRIIGESKSNPKDGSFFIVLPLGKTYGYFIDKNDYYPVSNNIDLRSENQPVEIENNINMFTFKQMKEEALAVPINNLFFQVNKDKVLGESIPELKRVAKIIITNNFNVEISGHTDNTGDDIYNQELSEKRAIAVRDYFISLGVPKDLMSTIGFGSRNPISTNDSELGKSKNRRVEMKFL